MLSVVAATVTIYLLLSTTSGLYWIDSWHNEQRAAQVVLLGFTGLVGAILAITGQSDASFRLGPWILVLVALGVTASIATPHRIEALAEISLFTLLCGLAALVAGFVRSSGSQATVIVGRAALFLAAAHVIGAFTRYAAALETQRALGTEIWMLGFSNPRVASSFYSLLLPLVAIATQPEGEPNRRLRGAAWATLALMWAVAFSLQARALWLSYALALPALLAMAPSQSARHLSKSLLVGAIAGAAIQWALPLPGMTGMSDSTARDLTSLNGREELWLLAWQAALREPLLGIGPGQFARLGSSVGAHPHNWVLQLSSEWGLPALTVALVALLALGRTIRKSANAGTARYLHAGATTAILVGFASGLVDGTFVMPSSQMAFALVFGVLLGAINLPRGNGTTARGTPAAVHWASAGMLIAAALCLAHQAHESYLQQPAERAAFQERFPGMWLVPRFWESGLKLTETR